MTIGGEPDELDRLAAGGPGQAFSLEHTARRLEHAADRHTARNRHSAVDPRDAIRRLRGIVRGITRLDHWVLLVAAALRTADAASIRSRLLQFGAGHPATAAVVGTRAVPVALPVSQLTDDELDDIAGWPRLPPTWRDRVHRERVRRWLTATEERVAAVPREPTGLVDHLARWVDERLIDHFSPVVDLHVSHAEAVARLRAQAAGARWLLARPGVTVWSFTPVADTPAGGPAIRVALGDPSSASHLAVFLPGTRSGMHAPVVSFAQASAIHRRTRELAADADDVATVLDLYDAPADLGRAADPRVGRAAGVATAAFLADLPATPGRTTLVGHSYGAYAAAQVRDQPLDALVLLGAPGAGVAGRDELSDVTEVWAAQAAGEPITVVADLDELLADLPPRLRPAEGPLADPLIALGPDPADPEFGARHLPTAPSTDDTRTATTGHADYLTRGTVALDNVARVVLGLPVR